MAMRKKMTRTRTTKSHGNNNGGIYSITTTVTVLMIIRSDKTGKSNSVENRNWNRVSQ